MAVVAVDSEMLQTGSNHCLIQIAEKIDLDN